MSNVDDERRVRTTQRYKRMLARVYDPAALENISRLVQDRLQKIITDTKAARCAHNWRVIKAAQKGGQIYQIGAEVHYGASAFPHNGLIDIVHIRPRLGRAWLRPAGKPAHATVVVALNTLDAFHLDSVPFDLAREAMKATLKQKRKRRRKRRASVQKAS